MTTKKIHLKELLTNGTGVTKNYSKTHRLQEQIKDGSTKSIFVILRFWIMYHIKIVHTIDAGARCDPYSYSLVTLWRFNIPLQLSQIHVCFQYLNLCTTLWFPRPAMTVHMKRMWTNPVRMNDSRGVLCRKSVLKVHTLNKSSQLTRTQLMVLYYIESHFYCILKDKN